MILPPRRAAQTKRTRSRSRCGWCHPRGGEEGHCSGGLCSTWRWVLRLAVKGPGLHCQEKTRVCVRVCMCVYVCPGLEAQFPTRRREERGCRPVSGKDRASCQSGGGPALRPGAVAQSPGREAALAWASLGQRFPGSSVLAREGAGCGSVASAPLWPSLWT